MTYTAKNRVSDSLFAMILIVFVFIITAGEAMTFENFEEDANMVMPSDMIITGKMNEYSESSIVVDGIRYSLCNGVKIFTPRNRMIPLKDIDAAEDVKLFRNNDCVRKIKVLRFAQ